MCDTPVGCVVVGKFRTTSKMFSRDKRPSLFRRRFNGNQIKFLLYILKVLTYNRIIKCFYFILLMLWQNKLGCFIVMSLSLPY
jgi:hypothetical protein